MKLDSRFRFENFVVGSRQRQPTLAIEYVALDTYMDELHQALQGGRLEPFKQRYESCGFLLLDDVQFLTGRTEVQAELLRLFGVLQGRGTQIVLASDRPPDEIADVAERLLARLAGGLTVDVGTPDYETRVAILQKLSREKEARFRDGVLEELARIDFSNIRELQGGLNRLIAHQGLRDVEVQPTDVRSLLSAGTTPATGGRPAAGGTDFAAYVREVATLVAETVPAWKVRLGEAAAKWRAEGVQVGVLERAMLLPGAPDVEGLISTFAAAVEYLRELERQGSTADPALAGHPIFLDPERVKEAHALVQQAVAEIEPPPAPDATRTFATFVEGEPNRLALRAAHAVVARPGTQFVPLVVAGPAGSGRSHLLHAIGNALAAAGTPNVACVAASAFAEELIAALRDGGVERWRARYRNAGALLLDDIDAIAGKERTQDELYHLFNALQSAGRQIVLTASRAPLELTALEERLRSRFAQGLVVELHSPDRALRRALHAQQLAQAGMTVAGDVLDLLAARPARSAGDVIATARRLGEAAVRTGTRITPGFVAVELDGAVARRGGASHVMADPERFVQKWSDFANRLLEDDA
ncbi:MAG: DnaA/Hda family protein [Gemmatimonadaceae bacterium]|nr:DnaA/Hda family protein [Gemmatimonadaceae bacterium]